MKPTIDPAVISRNQKLLHEMLNDVARLVPDMATAATVCNLRNTIRDLVKATDALSAAVMLADQRAAQIASDAANVAAAMQRAAEDDEMRLVPLEELGANAKDGRSIQRRNTEAQFADRRNSVAGP